MNKNILKTASMLSACLFLVTACADKDKESTKKQEAFDKALPKFETFKKASGCKDAVVALAGNWVKQNGPLHGSADDAIKELLKKETRDAIFALLKVDFAKKDKDAAEKGLKALIDKVSLADLKKGAEALDAMVKTGRYPEVAQGGVLTPGKAELALHAQGIFITSAEADSEFKPTGMTRNFAGGTGTGTNGDTQEAYQITLAQAKEVKGFLKAVSSFAGDSDVVAFADEITK